jgi:hypothetical protein
MDVLLSKVRRHLQQATCLGGTAVIARGCAAWRRARPIARPWRETALVSI